jgi:NAD(P)-dependent dehydrogenase (short-subunit alcohol dehydrogenase family)
MTKIALITGGASGIGEASARRFVADGHHVAILDRDADRGHEVMQDIGDAAHFFACDVADPDAIQQAVDGAVQAFGRIDACVAAAGILETPSTILDMDPAQHDRLWQINYNGTVHTCRAVGKVMAEQGSGAMVTLGSINSFVPLPLAAYCPSKTAILRLTEMLAVEMGRFGVRVNGVAPTYVMTPAIRARIESGERDPQAIRDSNALGMLVEPVDIANVIHFLCSDAARAVSGQMLPIDAAHMAKTQYHAFAGGVPLDG